MAVLSKLLTDASVRIEALEQEVSRLRGAVEDAAEAISERCQLVQRQGIKVKEDGHPPEQFLKAAMELKKAEKIVRQALGRG